MLFYSKLTKLICNKEVLKKKKLLFLFRGTRKLTFVKSRPNWDFTYAASMEALLLFFEPARLSILQNWLGFSGLSVALPLGLVVEVNVDSPEDKACAKVCFCLGGLIKVLPKPLSCFSGLMCTYFICIHPTGWWIWRQEVGQIFL